ncbi:MAG: hypothetical protein DRR15_17970 [Gammaproteobacteria bacterium]|nr:MAG: hypothetical protein DRR15_17970 [Gammaproteobacteria bacterium]
MEREMILKARLAKPTAVPIQRQGTGYSANGPGFYIWDEDVNEVLRMARELERGSVKLNRTTRFMLARETSEAS